MSTSFTSTRPGGLAQVCQVAVSLVFLVVAIVGGCSSNPDNPTPGSPDASADVAQVDAGGPCGNLASCGGACVDTSNDPQNCGVCGTRCDQGLVCSQGKCAVTCGGGTQKCASLCVDTSSSNKNCGACGNACPAGSACATGACVTTCAASQTLCTADAGTYCTNVSNDVMNCGRCGYACAAGLVCASGACVVTCTSNRVNCNRNCIDPNVDPQHCGATQGCGAGDAGTSGAVCQSGTVCSGGACSSSCSAAQVSCSGSCVDPSTDRIHCGATAGCGVGGVGSAGTTCPNGQVCGGGTCSVSCPGAQVNCGGTCVNPATDPAYCGATAGCGVGGVGSAGAACTNGQVCNAGACSVSCPGTQVNCGGMCVSPATDPIHCGATAGCGVGGVGSGGVACPGGQACSGGVCSVSCPGTQVNCSGSCVDTSSDRQHCGACPISCAPGENCVASSCQLSCPVGEISCAGVCVQPASDPTHCGASGGCTGAQAGTACTSQQRCSNGVCCGSGLVNCGGTCIDPTTSSTNCGASGSCTGASAGAACGAQQCFGGACVTPTTGTYNILTTGALVNLSGPGNGCSGQGEWQNNCSAPFGFSWTDTGNGTVQAASINFQLQGSCANNTQHAVTLNGVLIGSFANTNAGGCPCAPLQNVTLTPSTFAPYVVGGTNTLMIASSTCEGIHNNGGVLATVSVTYAQRPTPTVPTNGLLLRWELNDGAGTTAADASGNGRNGTMTGATWQTSGCKLGGCLRFSGAAGSYVSYGSSIPLGTPGTGASFAAWVNLDSPPTGTYQTIFNGPYSSCCTYRLLFDASGHPFWDAGTYSDQNPTSYTFPLAQWNHIVWTIQPGAGGNATLYVNGVQVVQSSGGLPASLTDMPNFDIGAADSFQWHAKGVFNDVLVYNRILSLAEITSIYQSY